MSNLITGLPGYPSGNQTWAPRKIRRGNEPPKYLDGGVTIKGSVSRDPTNTGYVNVLQPGKIMVKEASGGLYRPFIIGKTTAAYADNDTTLTVSAATATEIGRLLAVTGAALDLAFIGPPTAAGTVAATNISITAVASATTVTIADLNLNKVTDSLIALRAASYTPGSFCLIDDDDYTRVTDEDGNNINVWLPRPLIGGTIKTSQLLDWPADTSTVTYLKGLLNSGVGGYGFTFDDAF
jgi:hypothetical protein